MVTTIYQHLIDLHKQGKQVILLVDEAQALSDEGLETVRLLTNLETGYTKLIQVVLFGQPELNERLNKPQLRQLKQRISFSYNLPLMNREDLDTYIYHRLAVAGYTHGHLFTKKARNILFQASGGIPRMVNMLSHKALLVSYGRGDNVVNHKAIRVAVKDTEAVSQSRLHYLFLFGASLTALSVLIGLIIYLTETFYR